MNKLIHIFVNIVFTVAFVFSGQQDTVFCDDFSSGNDSKWTQLQNGADWAVENFEYHRGKGSQYTTVHRFISVANMSIERNYTVYVDVNLIDDIPGGWGAVCFRVQDSTTFYSAQYEPSTDQLQISRIKNSVGNVIASRYYTTEKNVWYRFRVDLIEDSIILSIDGNRLLAAKDTNFTAGPIGLGSWHAHTHFDNVVVTKTVDNNLPVFISTPDTVALENHLYTYPIVATDLDGDAISFTILAGPTGMELQNNTLYFSPTIEQVGIQAVSLRAEDSKGGRTIQNFNIRVLPRSGQVSLSEITPEGDTIIINEGDTLLFSVSAKSRNESATVSYQWYKNTHIVSSDSFYTLRTSFLSAGVCSVKVVAFDGIEFVELKWVVVVKNIPIKPVILSPSEGNPANGDSVFKWSCMDPDLDPTTTRYEVHFMLFSQQDISVKVLYALRDTEFVFRSFIERGELQEGRTYCWKVLAYDSQGDSVPFSNNGVFFFTDYGTAAEIVGKDERNDFYVYPNPFNPTTTFFMRRSNENNKSLQLYISDVFGRIVKVIPTAKINGKMISATWDGTDNNFEACPAGVYLCSIGSGSARKTIKLVLRK